MKISASVDNREGDHQVVLITDGRSHSIHIPTKPTGSGSSVNGGELLFLALATCYCNDIYREVSIRNLRIERVEVEVKDDFGSGGEPVANVTYLARVTAQASEAEIRELMSHTDRVAEIQNTLRVGTPVILSSVEVVTV